MPMTKDKNGAESDRFGTCDICGGGFDLELMEFGMLEVAEMYDPKGSLDVNDPDAHGIVHAECGFARGWEVA